MKSIKYLSLALMVALGFSACSDDFLEEKKNYDATGEEIYNYYEGALGRINDLYGWCLPEVTAMNWRYPSVGDDDDAGKSTEEYAGFSQFVNPTIELSSLSGTEVPDYYENNAKNVQENPWGTIRNINNAIEGITKGSLSEENKNKLLGQAYFFRAWTYYKFVKWYGGVPIVDKVLDASAEAFVPRSSAEECIKFIVADLDRSAELLKPFAATGGWESSGDYGRITSGAALALKGRVLTLWCSPLFNRTGDVSRYQEAYQIMKNDLATIDACGYGLYGEGNPGTNGSTFASMFATTSKNPEMVFGTLYNTLVDFSGYADKVKNNRWERYIRPSNAGGSGKTPSKALIDLFPMADGKRPTTAQTYTHLDKSSFDYDERYPFLNRDPRFYRTFAFPGVRWAYSAGGNGDATEMNPQNPSYNGGKDYVLWNYVWFYGEGSFLDENNNSYRGADNLGSVSGMFVRKKTDDYDVNAPVYEYRPDGQGAKNGAEAVPFISCAPLMELRYAEVLLNLAEVACGAGDMAYAVQQLNRIRARAGYTAANNYGLQTSLNGNQAACMSAILYERQIEFAYEGKRFDDMRRWMLYDGGAVKVNGAPESWTLTGWGGNTCTWLGFKPMNGQRRERFIYRTADKYGKAADAAYDKDVLLAGGGVRPEGVNLMSSTLQDDLQALKAWYEENLVWMQRPGDGRNSDKTPQYINFLPKYYFLGIKSGVMSHNKGLLQTAGWEDYNNGGAMGTYDPFEETHYWNAE